MRKGAHCSSRSLAKPVKSLLKALRILDALADCPSGLGISGLSDRLKTPKSTIHRLVATLESARYLVFDAPTSNYLLGNRIARLGEQLNYQTPLLTMGIPELQKLTRACHETSHLAILQATEVVYISHEESKEPVRLSFGMGLRAPAYCTALGKAALAGLWDDEILMLFKNVKKLRQLTPHTLPTPKKLVAEIATVRREGIAYDNEEYMRGLCCIAAPVRDFSSRIVAAIGLSVFRYRMTIKRKAFYKAALLEASADLSTSLGFTAASEEFTI